MIPNPYLEAFNKTQPPDSPGWPFAARHRDRVKLTMQYAWAVPTEEAVRVIADLPDIVEMGAGTGYWASLIAAAGGQIRCYDLHRGEANDYHWGDNYYPQETRGVEVLRADARDCKTLLLCWPPYDEPFGYQCLRSFRGHWLVYIGEDRGGCTGNYAMFRKLERDWTEVRRVAIPQWCGIHDSMWVYERKAFSSERV
jgi:hypothetical protein